MPNIRIIFSLDFELVSPDSSQSVQLIAPLDRYGMSPYITPLGKDRVIDLRVGDRLRHGQFAVTIHAA